MELDSDADLEIVLLLALHHRQRRRKKRRNMWVRDIFSRRQQQGEYCNLLQEMCMADPQLHFRYLRTSRESGFDCLLAEVYIGMYDFNDG